MVRLKGEKDRDKWQAMIFQFLMVRLKVRSVADKAFSTKFQFLMVRLKGQFEGREGYSIVKFQFLMVRLKERAGRNRSRWV